MNLNRNFPSYTEYDPKVPVWCVTPNTPRCIHRFFDTSPISPSGRYLAVFQLPFEDRQPLPGERGNIVLVDLETGEDRIVAESCGWEPQLGANINWGGSDDELFFNDVDTQNWRPFAWKLNPLTGERQAMDGTVYHASPDGNWLISANLKTMRKLQPGYGVAMPLDGVGRNVGPVADDGFYLTNTITGKVHMLASISEILEKASPAVGIEKPEKQEIYGFHSKFNPQGDRLMLSLRWFPASDEPRWNVFAKDHASVRFAWITMKLDGTEIRCAAGPDLWIKGGHHATWFPDGKRISSNLNIDGEGMRFVKFSANGSELGKILNAALGSGHPSVHPNGNNLITDAYNFEDHLAYGDGTVPIRWFDLSSSEETKIIRIHTQEDVDDIVMRIDPHPAWDRTWRYVTFNGFVGGTRRVFIADMASLLDGI